MLKLKDCDFWDFTGNAATFGWLCVETSFAAKKSSSVSAATFGWLCVETRQSRNSWRTVRRQPPSGGCVLKLILLGFYKHQVQAATFGWLCVETAWHGNHFADDVAATFGWLCVETPWLEIESLTMGGRPLRGAGC